MTTTTVESSGADLLVSSLINHGIGHIFGVPGDTGINFYDALRARSADIEHILCRDERHSAYMADGYGRTTRKLAVCEASSGAGAVYLASGLAESFASSIPTLVITTDIHRSSRGSGAITEIDQVQLFRAVTKAQFLVDSASDIPGMVHEAIACALSDRPGPVVMIFPEDVLDESTTAPASYGTSYLGNHSANPTQEGLLQAADWLQSSKRPVIIAGGGIHASEAWTELRELAEHLSIPVATTIHGKSSFPENHPLSLGVTGGNGCRGYSLEWIESSDTVLIVGSRANSTDTNGFTAPPRMGSRIIQIDIDESRCGTNFPNSVKLVGDASSTLKQLHLLTESAPRETSKYRKQWILNHRTSWRNSLSDTGVECVNGTLSPRDIVEALHEVFGRGAWVAGDAGTPTPYLSAYWETDGDDWRVVVPRGHGPMGYAISAAIGISVAHSNARVLCFTTEGSLAMGIADWETATRLKLPITFVVLNNDSFGWIKMLQHLFMGERYFQVEPGPIDPVKLSEGMGIPAVDIRSIDELRDAAVNCLNIKGPTVLHIRVPEHYPAVPPVAPWQRAINDPGAGRPVY